MLNDTSRKFPPSSSYSLLGAACASHLRARTLLQSGLHPQRSVLISSQRCADIRGAPILAAQRLQRALRDSAAHDERRFSRGGRPQAAHPQLLPLPPEVHPAAPEGCHSCARSSRPGVTEIAAPMISQFSLDCQSEGAIAICFDGCQNTHPLARSSPMHSPEQQNPGHRIWTSGSDHRPYSLTLSATHHTQLGTGSLPCGTVLNCLAINPTSFQALAPDCDPIPPLQATHDVVPPETLAPVLKQLVDQFISDRTRPEVMAIGLKTVRELAARSPLIMTSDLLRVSPQRMSTLDPRPQIGVGGLL